MFSSLCALVLTALASSQITNVTATPLPPAVDWRLFIIPGIALAVAIGYILFELYELVYKRAKKSRHSEECGVCL